MIKKDLCLWKKQDKDLFYCLKKNCWIACYIRILLDMNMRVHRFANNDINQAGCVKLKVQMEKNVWRATPERVWKIIPAICTPCFAIYLGFSRRGSLQQLNLSWSSCELWHIFKNHSCNLRAKFCSIFCLNSVVAARYDNRIRAKSPINYDAHLAESLFQTLSDLLTFQMVWNM